MSGNTIRINGSPDYQWYVRDDKTNELIGWLHENGIHQQTTVRANDEFKIGDVVMLKSGGPQMTVIDKEAGYVVCQWFGDVYLAYKQHFSTSALKNAGPET